MTAASTTPLITSGDLAKAAAATLAGAALSAEQHPTLVRGVGLVLAAGLGSLVALTAGGVVGLPGEEPADDGERQQMGPVAAAALGLGTFAVTAGASELGLRGQRRLERWADRTTGHPRLTVGVLSGALSLALDVAQRTGDR